MTLSVDNILGRYFVTAPDGRSLATGGWLDAANQGPQFQFLTEDAATAAATGFVGPEAGSLVVSFEQVPEGVLMNTAQAAVSFSDRAARDAIAAVMDRVAALEAPAAPAAKAGGK